MLKGYKTLIFNTLVGIVGLAEVTGTISLIAPTAVPYVIAAIAIANILLRFGTDTGVFKKE